MANVEALTKLKKPYEAYQGDAPYVFVSYSHRDVEIVFIELVRLRKLGFRVWYDEGLSPGSRWSDELAERIANCALFLYYVTPRSAASQNCQDEANYVLEAGNPFLAVHLEETELPPGLKLRTGSRQAILRYELEPGTYYRKLYAAITSQAPELVQRDLTQAFRLGEYKVEPLIGDITGPDGEAHHLEPKVMDVFVYLAEHAGELVTRHQLLEAVWPGQVAADELLTRAISELRRVLQHDGDKKCIETVPKRGYRLVGKIWAFDASGHEILSSDSFVIPTSTTAVKDSERIEATKLQPRGRKTAVIGLSMIVAVLMGASIFELMPVPPPPVVSNYKELSTSQLIFPPTPSQVPLVADASRIYFNDWYGGRLGMQQLSQAGGEASRLELPFDPNVTGTNPLAMSPDQSQLLILVFRPGASSESEEFWLWPVVGGKPRRLGKGIGAAYSPDGSKLLYANDNDEIYLANADLSEPRLLVTAPGKVYWPRFSPDGRRIRFTVSDDYSSLYEVAADGTGLYRVLPEWSEIDHCCGSWTPDGRHFVFHAVHDYRTKLWAIRERQGFFGRRQSTPVQITTGALDFRRPTIAADGKRIFAIGWQLKGEVVRYDDASRQFVPMLARESLSGEWLEFSPDEEWIAYVSHPGASLWRSRSDGTDRMQLTFPPMHAFAPVWSPDGKTLAFAGETPGEGWKIYLVSGDGGTPQAITDSNAYAVGPTWSPDGNSLAFNEKDSDFIRILDITTGVISKLEGSDGLRWPRWSPDGRYIAAYADASLHLLNVAEGQTEKLVELEEYEGHFWSKDSQYIYYSDPFYSGSDRSMRRVHIGDKTTEKIATVGNFQMAWGIWGPWIGIAPDGAPLALRNLSIHNIYSLNWEPD